MRIKHFIVTYRNNRLLKDAIDSIFVNVTEHERFVFVISNHSDDRYDGPHPVQFLRNETRPDFSTGHLSRNWNQAIINGFVDLKQPNADILILSQNDCKFEKGYLDACLQLHETYDLVTYGAGDNCVSYTPRAVTRIGLWDERFCNIGYQEADYFLRAAIHLGSRASINDHTHRRLHNPVNNVNSVIMNVPTGFVRKDEAHMASMKYHRQSFHTYMLKWGRKPEHWPHDYMKTQQMIDNYILYPYFEKNIETLKEQRYMAFFA